MEGNEYMINLATTRVPNNEDFRTMFGPGVEIIKPEVQSLVMRTVIEALAKARLDSETWSVGENFGFRDLLSALHANPREDQEVLRAAWEVRRVMNLDVLQPSDVEREVEFVLRTTPADNGLRSDSDNYVPDHAETEDLDAMSNANREPSQGLRGLLYYIAEENAKRNAYEHRGIHCEECNLFPITGTRWHCLNCPDYDLCSSCETHTRHPKTHVFAKIKIPLPLLSQPTKEYRIWYPGDPKRVHSSLDPVMRKRLGNEHNFEEPQMDALYDQFLTIANVPRENDPSRVQAAIDRRAFNKAMSSERWPSGFATNAMFDRMFAFYDTDNNGIIGFDEFLSGMAYLRGPRRYASLRRALEGYDVDGDGYLNRNDFLRLLHAKYIIQKQLVHDSVEGQQWERTQAGLETLRSSQPISSIFAQEDIPPGETRPPRGKQPDLFGDLQPSLETKCLLDEKDPFTANIIPAAHERLATHLSRFEDILYGASSSHHSASETTLPNDRSEDRGTNQQAYDTALSQVLDVESFLSDQQYQIEEPYMQDALWHVIEQGFNDLLDRLFKHKEAEDERIISTREERQKWREHIDARKAADQTFRKQLIATAATDPLMATAMNSHETRSNNRSPPELPPRPHSNRRLDQPVATDWDGLTRREAEISDASRKVVRPGDEIQQLTSIFIVNDLLDATGYRIRDNSTERGISSPHSHIDNWDPSTDVDTASSISKSSQDELFDPTLPQHKSNSLDDGQSQDRQASALAHEPQGNVEKPPSKQWLQYLAVLDNLEQEFDERGGPGRLSYDEIERLAVADSRGEVRGLVKSWLDWAAF